MSQIKFGDKKPKVDASVFLAPSSWIIGDVTIKKGSGVWNGAVIRGDDDSVFIGERSTILENCIIEAPVGSPVRIGDDAIISHGAIVHGAHIADKVLIGIGAIILDGAKVGYDSIIGAGSVVPPKAVIPPNTLALGTPAKPVRGVRDEERKNVNLERKRVISKASQYKKIYVK